MLPTRLFDDTMDSLAGTDGSMLMYSLRTGNGAAESQLTSTFASSSYASFCSSDSELSEISASFQNFSIDIDGMGRELMDKAKRDTELIRQDFLRNGIDSSVHGKSGTASNRPPQPPGLEVSSVYSKWPLANLGNRKETNSQTTANSTNYGSSLSIPSRRKRSKENDDYCVFCFNNREDQETYLGHSCRDEEGFVVCPRLRRYICPYCHATGRLAHTKKYCPKKPIITPTDLENMTLETTLAGVDGNSNSGRNGRSRRVLRF